MASLFLFIVVRWLATLSVSDFSRTEAESHEPLGQSEIIFLGTGTSEGIPRVSCLTNQSKTCPVRLLPFKFIAFANNFDLHYESCVYILFF